MRRQRDMLGIAAWMGFTYLLTVIALFWVIGVALAALALVASIGGTIDRVPMPLKFVLGLMITWVFELGWPIFAVALAIWAAGWMLLGLQREGQ